MANKIPRNNIRNKKISSNTRIVHMLGSRIIQGRYSEGEQLPVEASLAEEFGVSRPMVREATKILASKGLLTAKPRIGTLVTRRTHWNLLDGDVLTWVIESKNNHQFLDMLFDVRSAIEPKAAELAAANASAEELAIIHQAWQDMAKVESLEDSFEPDLRFHVAIYEASHNDFLRYIGGMMCNALLHSFGLTSWNKRLYDEAILLHKAVYQAIALKDPKKAIKAVVALLESSRKDFDLRQG